MLRIVLLILTVILFPSNYFICELFYPGIDEVSIISWNKLNDDITHVIIFLSLLNLQLLIKSSSSIRVNKWYQFVLYIGIGLSSSDVIDRWIIQQRQFSLVSDIIMIVVVLYYGYRQHLKE